MDDFQTAAEIAKEAVNTAFFVRCFAAGCFGGICRRHFNRDPGTVWNSVAVGSFSGCLAFAIVGSVAGYRHDIAVFYDLYIGLAMAVGICHKETVFYLPQFLVGTLKKLGFSVDNTKGQT